MPDLAARAEAEGRLVQSCVIRRRGTDTYSTGGITAVAGAIVYIGACQLGRPNPGTKTMTGSDDRMLTTRKLRLPAAATGVQVTDVATIDGTAHIVVAADDRHDDHVTLRTVTVVASVDAEAVPQ